MVVTTKKGDIVNLLEETNRILGLHGKDMDDICWVGCGEYLIPLKLWPILADREYDNDYGFIEVDLDLLVVGDSWWLERHEYDGSEWWEYKELPPKPSDTSWVPDIFGGSI